MLFFGDERDQAADLLVHQCGQNLPFFGDAHPEDLDRYLLAALKVSQGNMDFLIAAVELAKADWRDLLMSAGFGHDVSAHMHWYP
ncbi:MAG: hypothetical protein AAGA29_03205 [Planctomycetota bacterium]